MIEPQNSSTLNTFGCFLGVSAFFSLFFGLCAVQCSKSKEVGVTRTPPPLRPEVSTSSPRIQEIETPPRPKAIEQPTPPPLVAREASPREPDPAPTLVEEAPEPPPQDANIKKRLDDLLSPPEFDPEYMDAVYIRNVSKSPIKLYVHVAKGTWEPRTFKPGIIVYLTSTDLLTLAYEVPGKGYKRAPVRRYHQPHWGNAPVDVIRKSALLYDMDRETDELLTFAERPRPGR